MRIFDIYEAICRICRSWIYLYLQVAPWNGLEFEIHLQPEDLHFYLTLSYCKASQYIYAYIYIRIKIIYILQKYIHVFRSLGVLSYLVSVTVWCSYATFMISNKTVPTHRNITTASTLKYDILISTRQWMLAVHSFMARSSKELEKRLQNHSGETNITCLTHICEIFAFPKLGKIAVKTYLKFANYTK